MYINDHVGMTSEGTYGSMYFNTTLNDWAKFNINNRTKFDASISSGLAVMACNRQMYAPNPQRKRESLNIMVSKYNNDGSNSRIINR
jgi:hypothetical protein